MLRHEIVRAVEPRARRTRCEPGNRIGDRRQRFGVDLDQPHGVFGKRAAFGHDERDGLADIAELVIRRARTDRREAGSPQTAAPAECGRASDQRAQVG